MPRAASCRARPRPAPAFDYLVDVVQADPSAAPILDETWRAVIEHTSPKDTTLSSDGLPSVAPHIACEAYAKAVTAGISWLHCGTLAAPHISAKTTGCPAAGEAMVTICDRHGRDGDDCLMLACSRCLAGRAGHTRHAGDAETIVAPNDCMVGLTNEHSDIATLWLTDRRGRRSIHRCSSIQDPC
jgi:hypothetical protein